MPWVNNQNHGLRHKVSKGFSSPSEGCLALFRTFARGRFGGALWPWVARSKGLLSFDTAFVRDRLPRVIHGFPPFGGLTVLGFWTVFNGYQVSEIQLCSKHLSIHRRCYSIVEQIDNPSTCGAIRKLLGAWKIDAPQSQVSFAFFFNFKECQHLPDWNEKLKWKTTKT